MNRRLIASMALHSCLLTENPSGLQCSVCRMGENARAIALFNGWRRRWTPRRAAVIWLRSGIDLRHNRRVRCQEGPAPTLRPVNADRSRAVEPFDLAAWPGAQALNPAAQRIGRRRRAIFRFHASANCGPKKQAAFVENNYLVFLYNEVRGFLGPAGAAFKLKEGCIV